MLLQYSIICRPDTTFRLLGVFYMSFEFNGSSCVPTIAILVATIFACYSELPAQTSVSVNVNNQRFINGVSDFERSRFFNFHGTLVPPTNTNLGNLLDQVISADHLHTSPGRTSTEFDQFITNDLPEDPSNPSFINPTSLINKLQGSYRSFLLFNNRWRPLRDDPAPFLVNAGRSSSFWPAFFRTDPNTGVTSNHYPYLFAYAEFLTTYLDEVVYGSNSYLPIDSDRMVIELLNEPELHLNSTFDWQDMIDYHRTVAMIVKGAHPDAKIIGPSLAITNFAANAFDRWNTILKPFIEGAGADMDGYSFHPYERYHGFANGTYTQDIRESPGRVQATIDLIENHNMNFHGELKPLAITEYGSWQLWDVEVNGEPFIGDYARDLQQWDLCRNVMEKMHVFLQHPHLILNATPFVSARHWQSGLPTNAAGDNVFYEQDEDGNWIETIVGKMFRLLSKIDGQYISSSSDNPDVQIVSFRDGDKVFVMLNNMESISQTVNIQLDTGSANVVSANVDRIYRENDTNTFVDDEDVTSTFQSLNMKASETAVLTVQLNENSSFEKQIFETVHYGNETVVPINSQGTSGDIGVVADPTGAVAAKLRVGFTRPGSNPGELFIVGINDITSVVVDSGELAYDDLDYDSYSREIDIPLFALTNGTNNFDFNFSGNGGFIGSVALILTTETIVGPQSAEPTQFVIENGNLNSGQLSDLINSDDSYLQIYPDATSQPPIQIVFDGNVNSANPTSFNLQVETGANTSNLEQTVEVFNWTTASYQSVGSSSVTLNDSTITMDLTGSISDLIQPQTGAVRARVAVVPQGPVLMFPWSYRMDELVWTFEN